MSNRATLVCSSNSGLRGSRKQPHFAFLPSLLFCLLSSLSNLLGQAAPSNDLYANAIVVSGHDVQVQTDNTGAGREPDEPRAASNIGGRSLWYRWTAPESGLCRMEGTGNGFNLLLEAFVGNSLKTLTPVSALDHSSPTHFEVIAGQIYHLRIDGFFGEQGVISWSMTLRPSNDQFANRLSLVGVRHNATQSFTGATLEAGESALIGTTDAGTAWWTWTAPVSTRVALTTTSETEASRVMVFRGTAFNNFTSVASSGGSLGLISALNFHAQEGQAYQIAVITATGAQGNVQLSLSAQALELVIPFDGAVFAAPAMVTLRARLPSEVTTPISQMRYYVNGQLVGTSVESPFERTWTSSASGSFRMWASATTTDGATHVSVPMNILIYSGQDLPTPRVFTGPAGRCSFVMNAVGGVTVFGVAGEQFGLPINENMLFPQYARVSAGTSRWKKIEAGWEKDVCWDFIQNRTLTITNGQPDQLWAKSVALDENGRLYRTGTQEIVRPAGVTRWLDVSYGAHDFLALGDNGRVYLGGTLPLEFTGVLNWVAVVAGNRTISTLSDDGRAVRHSGDWSNPTLVSAELFHPTGVTRWLSMQGGVLTWLMGDDGNLYAEIPGGSNVRLLNKPSGVTVWRSWSAGSHHVLAIGDDGNLYAWGRNWEGQLGTGAGGGDFSSPQLVPLPPGVTGWITMAAGYQHSLAIGNDCRLYTWGHNFFGELGIGRRLNQFRPVQVSLPDALCGIPVMYTGGETGRLPDGRFKLEFKTDLNRAYIIQYSDDLTTWKNATGTVVGTGAKTVWTDAGPPVTDSHPGNGVTRYYRVTSAP